MRRSAARATRAAIEDDLSAGTLPAASKQQAEHRPFPTATGPGASLGRCITRRCP